MATGLHKTLLSMVSGSNFALAIFISIPYQFLQTSYAGTHMHELFMALLELITKTSLPRQQLSCIKTAISDNLSTQSDRESINDYSAYLHDLNENTDNSVLLVILAGGIYDNPFRSSKHGYLVK